MSTAFHFGYVEEHLYVFRETFTGNGAATTFQLTSNVGNATFETGSWTVVNVETAMAADASKTTGAALYDSLLPLVRHKITVSSISATGLVTLNYAPMAENFYIWYWYDMEGDAIQDYYRDDYVSSMEADAGVTVASGITVDVTAFGDRLSAVDDTVQKALDTLDDHGHPATDISPTTSGFASVLSASDDTVQKALDTLDDHYHSTIWGALAEPTGFPNRTASAFTFADGTRKLTVTVVSGSYTYWMTGVAYTISTTKEITIADTEGVHYIYFDTDSALHEYVNPSVAEQLTMITTKVLVALVYWDATNNTALVLGEERHGCNMTGYTHYYLHMTRGLQYVDGLDLSDIVIGDASLDTHAQFGVTSGTIVDEDIGLTTTTVASTVGLTILYRLGVNGDWRKLTQAGFACYQNPDGTTHRLMWNEYTGGAWKLTEVTEANFVLYHVFVTTGKTEQLFSIMGQNTYTSVALARAGAEVEISTLLLGTLPGTEIRPVATVIFQTDKDYGNTINARIVEDTDGNDYVDWTTTEIARGSAAIDSALYLHIDGSRALAADWDAGSFKITAETFASDVATGTAPLTIASATLVTNLNVDQVDSLHAQTLTATSPITLSGVTSVLAAAGITIAHAATAGNVHVPTAGATGQILIYGGASGTAAWTTATYPATTTAFKLLVSTATSVVGELVAGGSAGQYLRGATGAIPAWSTLTLPDTATAFKLAAYTATNVMTELVAVGTTGQYLRAASGAIPAWSTLTLPDTATAFKLAAYTATNVMTELVAVGTTGQYLRAASGAIPAWSTMTLPNTATAYRLPVYSATNVMTELVAVGGTGEYLAGAAGAIPAWATLNQAAVEGLTTASSPGFVTVKLSGLTDGYVPYHVSDASGLANSIITVTSSAVTIGTGSADVDYALTFNGETNDGTITWMEDEKYFAFSNNIEVGTNDTSYGTIRIYGDGTGSGQGGALDFYAAADYDTSINYYRIYCNQDTLSIGPNTETNAIVYNASKVLTLLAGSISLTAGSVYAKGGFGANVAAETVVNYYSRSPGSGSGYYSIVCYKGDGTTLLFYVRDDGVGYVYGDTWNYGPSSRDIKENIRNLKDEIPDIRKVIRGIVPRRYDFKESYRPTDRRDKVGYIAEDLELVIPGVIRYNNTLPGHPEPQMTFDRDRIIPYMVLGIHDVMDETESLRSSITSLESLVIQLQAEIASLKKGKV